jgi:predicted small lipoprotein YifL
MNKLTATLLAGLLASALTACGSKGQLQLPPGSAPEPLLGKSKMAPNTGQNAAQNANPSDLSTDPKARPE